MAQQFLFQSTFATQFVQVFKACITDVVVDDKDVSIKKTKLEIFSLAWQMYFEMCCSKIARAFLE
jgi:hypothetical protein